MAETEGRWASITDIIDTDGKEYRKACNMKTLLTVLLLLVSSACLAQNTTVTVPLSGGGAHVIVHDPHEGMRTYTFIPPMDYQPRPAWPSPAPYYGGLDTYDSGYGPVLNDALFGPLGGTAD